MPVGIFLYEIEKSFGPKIIAEYYVGKDKISNEILKEFNEKHIKRNLTDAIVRTENLRYYSSKIHAESIKKANLFLGFILKEGEDLLSLKSVFESIEEDILQNFSTDKRVMQNLLMNTLTSILSLMEKIKEPKVIQEKINERTKDMLDDGKLQEARDLIALGEKIPQKLSSAAKAAEGFFRQKLYKKAAKNFMSAADLALQIQEEEIYSFLQNKATQIEKLPELLKKRENFVKEINKNVNGLNTLQLNLYDKIIPILEEIINISNEFEEDVLVENLIKLNEASIKASELANQLSKINDEIKSLIKKI